MKFLLDVNASGSVAGFLLERGHDVRRVSERDIRMSDDQILKWAVKERRIIVTTDKDFESMIWRENRIHSGIIRLENLPRKDRLKLLARILIEGPYVLLLSKKCEFDIHSLRIVTQGYNMYHAYGAGRWPKIQWLHGRVAGSTALSGHLNTRPSKLSSSMSF